MIHAWLCTRVICPIATRYVSYASRLIMHSTLGELIYDGYREPIVHTATIITTITTPLQ